jgi:hypothetical protein
VRTFEADQPRRHQREVGAGPDCSLNVRRAQNSVAPLDRARREDVLIVLG